MINKVESAPYVAAISSLLLDYKGSDASNWLKRLDFISSVVDSGEEFTEFYRNPKTSDEQVFDFLSGLCQSEDIERNTGEEFNNFLRLIIRNKRLNLLSSIYYVLRENESCENIYEIDTPYILTGKELRKIDLGKGSIIEKQRIDRKLISGIKIRTGTSVYDLSTRDRLDYFKLHIMNRG
jgi:ATP synthase F1 delta subunit